MNRESKFKAGDKKKGGFVFEGTLADIRHAGGKLNFTTWIWTQSTGLKDKNGKDIYEGDIVGVRNKSFTYKAVIALGWSDDGEYGWCQKRDGLSTIIRNVDFVDERYEIFGNIYQNPDQAKQIVMKKEASQT
jgi:uncharacterized phage protein (TIGR01671 family)